MVKKHYKWDDQHLDDHTRRKHKILKEYFFNYIVVRCQVPKQEKFRLAVVDGFSGAGRYECGSGGSPIIFIEELRNALETVNLRRAAQSLSALEIECLLILNDADPAAVESLKTHCAPLTAEIKDTCPKLHLDVRFLPIGLTQTPTRYRIFCDSCTMSRRHIDSGYPE